jgi:hypothetical protein
VAKFVKDPIHRTSYRAEMTLLSKIIFIVTVTLTFDLMTLKYIGFSPYDSSVEGEGEEPYLFWVQRSRSPLI